MQEIASPPILAAHVTGAHGIKGDVVLKVYLDAPDMLIGKDFPCGRLSSLRPGPRGLWVGRFDSAQDRTQAEALKGAALNIPRDTLPPAQEGEYYHCDLIGLAVWQGDNHIGRVHGVPDFGAGSLLDIMLKDGRSFFLPFRAPYVGEINIHEGIIRVENVDAFL